MNANQLFLSTIADDCAATARQHGLGLEIAEYCTAANMDAHFACTDTAVRERLRDCPRRLLHAPFNELFPCAIDPKARELAALRYRQAIALAQSYGAEKVIIHGGYHPMIYYPIWYVEQSIVFWKEFLKDAGPTELVLENVLEEEPSMLMDIVRAVDDSRLRLCLDLGHVNAYSSIPAVEWLRAWAPYLSHFHVHNNSGDADRHCAPDQGTLPMESLLRLADQLCPRATYTLELMETRSSVCWLNERGLLTAEGSTK